MVDEATLAFLLLIWTFDLWELYLHKRELTLAARSSNMPKAFVSLFNSSEYDFLRINHQHYTSAFIFTTGLKLFVKTLVLLTPYHPTLWSLTAIIVPSLERAALFAALHDTVTKMCLVPFVMLASFSSTEPGAPLPWIVFIVSVIQVSLSAAHSAMFVYALGSLIELYGLDIFIYVSIAYPVVGFVFGFLGIIFERLELYPLTMLSIARSLKKLAVKVGYPPSSMYVSKAPEINAAYVGMFGISSIVITHALAKVLNLGQVCAIVAHELGHWAYGAISTPVFLIHLTLGSFSFYLSTYGVTSDFGYRMFSLSSSSDTPPAVVLIFLGLLYLKPVMNGALNGIHSFVMRGSEFNADDFSVRQGYASHLKSALIKTYEKSRLYPVEDKWFSAWYHSHPSLQERIARIENNF